MKQIALLLVVNAILLLGLATTAPDQIEVSQAEIQAFSKSFAPNKYVIQTDCCYPKDKTDETIAHGARCATGGSSYCAENPCPEGTIECGSK
jgi:hypothetical protein